MTHEEKLERILQLAKTAASLHALINQHISEYRSERFLTIHLEKALNDARHATANLLKEADSLVRRSERF